MKAFLGTLSALAVAIAVYVAVEQYKQRSIIDEVLLVSGLCNTTDRKVKDPENFVRCLEHDGIEQSHYRVRLSWKKDGHDPRDRDAGSAAPCEELRWGGGQITQHIHLTEPEMELFAKCRTGFHTSSATPTPTP